MGRQQLQAGSLTAACRSSSNMHTASDKLLCAHAWRVLALGAAEHKDTSHDTTTLKSGTLHNV